MTYKNIIPGIFISRPNRFIAEVEIDGNVEICHVKNTGRCKELLITGGLVYLQRADNPNRTTKYDLITVRKGERLINMDSNAPNKVFLEYLQSGAYIKNITLIKPEAQYGSSRFDFYVEAGGRRIFIEVKGVTLEENGVVMFPDAPTERGVKHLNELAQCVSEGYEAHVVFAIQLTDVKQCIPNYHTHPAFGAALVAAKQAGVAVAAFDCEVGEDSLEIRNAVEVRL